jgi:hypothetical protein
MSKVSYTSGEVIQFPLWLIFNLDGSVRLTRREPGQLSRDERALRLDAALPLSLWATPVLSATLSVEAPGSPAMVQIDVTAASEALRGALGVDIELQVRGPEA